MPIITLPNPILFTPAKPVDFASSDDLAKLDPLIADMHETLAKGKGVGLAANQVGSLLRVVMVHAAPYTIVAINPVFRTVNGTENDTIEEGCLSDPGNRYLVSRPKQIWLEYYTREGKLVKKRVGGMEAKIWQHEIDHLNGINIKDKK